MEISQEEAHVLFINACRYAYGRASYTNSFTAGIVKNHINELKPSTCSIIARDIIEGLESDGRLTKVKNSWITLDVKPWVDLLSLLDERAKERDSHKSYTHEEEIVRCGECEYASSVDGDGDTLPNGALNCTYLSEWDYYDDSPGSFIVGSDDFCCWGKRSK